jgi:type I restriction enzyme S subunit
MIYLESTWAKHSKGSTFDSVNSNDVRAVEIRLPVDPAEQIAIAAVLSDMDAELTALEARLEKTRALKQAMMQELLTGRIRLVTPKHLHA